MTILWPVLLWGGHNRRKTNWAVIGSYRLQPAAFIGGTVCRPPAAGGCQYRACVLGRFYQALWQTRDTVLLWPALLQIPCLRPQPGVVGLPKDGLRPGRNQEPVHSEDQWSSWYLGGVQVVQDQTGKIEIHGLRGKADYGQGIAGYELLIPHHMEDCILVGLLSCLGIADAIKAHNTLSRVETTLRFLFSISLQKYPKNVCLPIC